MNKKTKLISASETMSERAMTGLFSRAFSQPLKLLGQTEASLSSYAVFWCVAYNDGATQVEVANMTGLSQPGLYIAQSFADANSPNTPKIIITFFILSLLVKNNY